MPRAVLIANPSASQFTGGMFRRIRTTLERAYDLTTEWPTGPTETESISTAAAGSGVDVVFAMGGDGVAHHVANGVAGTSTALGLIPAGTTNVLSRILGIPQKPHRAAESAIDWSPQPTRILRVDARTDVGETARVATFSLGFGFDADVVDVAETRPFAKSRFGGVHYATTAVARLVSSWRDRAPNLRITCDGDRFDALAALTQVHDPYTYFGRVPLRLGKDVPDGAATLAANDLGLLRATEIVTRSVLGRPPRDATGTRLWTGFTTMTVDADPPTPFQADGELLGLAHHATVRPEEAGMLVLRPEAPDRDDAR